MSKTADDVKHAGSSAAQSDDAELWNGAVRKLNGERVAVDFQRLAARYRATTPAEQRATKQGNCGRVSVGFPVRGTDYEDDRHE